MFIEYRRPCATAIVRDGFAAHIARGSVLPGTDYACKTGDHAFAAADGTVTAVDLNPNDARGMSLIIKFRDGRVGEYLHLSRIFVKVGQRVKKGDTVALTGNTGTTSTGPHLHFSFRTRLGRLIDFVPFLNANERKAEKRRKRRRRRNQPE